MKIASVILCVLFLTIHLSAQSVADAPRLLSYEIVKSYTQEDLQIKWKESGIPKSIAPIRYDVDIYEIIYSTCWHDSTCIKASGLYFLPKNAVKPPMLVYHHGTQIEKERKVKLGGEIAICMGYATDGYAVLFPDYIGLGKGEKFHLYHHIKTEAYASIDLIRAVRILNAEKGFQMGNHLFATGYSQGGHATMAFQKVVEADPELHKEFKITATAPMSGAYDLTGVQEKNMFEPYSHPGYLPYLLVGFQESYQLYENLNAVLSSPYDVSILPLFDGNHSMGEVNKAMPKIPKDVFKPEIVEEYLSNENFPFKVALRENSTHRWVPKVPMMLCYCEGDEQVNYMNSVVAYKSMKSLGAKHIRLKRVSKNMNHGTCALYSVLYSKMFFDSFVSGSKYGRKGPLSKRMLISIGKKQMIKKAKKKAKKKS
jgi:hypothetical protein